MIQNDPLSFYKANEAKEQNALEIAKRQIFWISFLRLSVFLGGLIAVILLFRMDSQFTIYAVFGGIIMFLALVKIHTHFFSAKRLIENRLRIFKEEQKSIDGNHFDFDDGSRFMHRSKAYTYDLDIFGPQSLYQKINRTTTIGGAGTLAQWFNFSEQDPQSIIRKQEAVKELSEINELRINFRAQGLMVDEEKGEYRSLISWLKEKDLFLGKLHFKVIVWLASIINSIGIVAYFMGHIDGNWVAATLFLSLLFVGFWQKRIHRIHQSVGSKVKLLTKYVKLLQLVEKADFKSEFLNDLQQKLGSDKDLASLRIQHLSKILGALDTRLNVFAGILLNATFLWDIRQILRLEEWKSKNRKELLVWFSALSQVEALNSLATLSFNNPNWIYPEISTVDFELHASGIRHPLMQDVDCVGNDLTIPSRPHFKVITGANMAGKSTFLRSLGTNMLLTMMGSPVSSVQFKMSPIELISSIRTKDSLMKNESYFYAEIKRLEEIIKALKNGKKHFVFLDEILKGTNSKDKEQGSKALLKQLIELKAVGVIATHDLNLGVISKEFESYVDNRCFEVEIKDGGLDFDYKIRSGIAQNLSATYLMKEMGITI